MSMPPSAVSLPINLSVEKVHVVEYLRAAASLAVAWFHLTNTYEFGFVRSLGGLGWLGVDVFFVISGFVIPYSLWMRYYYSYNLSKFPEFIVRRIVRLEPPYLISIGLVIVLWELSAISPGFQGGDPTYSAPQVIAHIGYMPPVFGYDWLQPVYWTLAFEFMFYVTVGLTFAFILKHGMPMVLGITLAGLVLSWGLNGQFEPRLLLFTMGFTVFMTVTRLISTLPCCIMIGSCFIAIVLLNNAHIALAGMIASGVIVSAQRIKLSSAVGRVLMFLGTISYSLYVVHVPIGGRVVNLGRRFIDGPEQELALSLVALSISIVAAYIFYIAVERRFVHASKAILRHKADRSPTP